MEFPALVYHGCIPICHIEDSQLLLLTIFCRQKNIIMVFSSMLKRVTNHDYLGVTISSDLNWLRHVKKF